MEPPLNKGIQDVVAVAAEREGRGSRIRESIFDNAEPEDAPPQQPPLTSNGCRPQGPGRPQERQVQQQEQQPSSQVEPAWDAAAWDAAAAW